MFNLRKLEDRIVLDGAGMHDALDEIQKQEAHDLEKHFHAQEAHNVHDWDYGLDFDQPLYLDGIDAAESDDAGVHVLVISSDINDADDLAAAAKDDVMVIRYDASETSVKGLSDLIEKALDGKKADSIAFAAHNSGDAQVNMTWSDVMTSETLENSADQQDFWRSVGSLLSENGRIDLLACDVLKSDNGEIFVSKIEDLSGAAVAASTDATGSDAYGGDWVLERGGVDIQHTYFDADKLKSFDGILANRAPVSGPQIGLQSVMQYDSWHFTLPAGTFTDPDGDTLSYKSYSWMRPSWMTFAGSTFSATPSSQDYIGTWPITVIALDPSYAGASMAFNVQVMDKAEAPILQTAIGTQAATQHSMWTYTVPVGTFIDPDGKTITYTAQDMPPGMSFNSTTRTFSWMPDGAAGSQQESAVAGSPWSVKLVATDPDPLSTGTNFLVTVKSVNDAPYLATAPAGQTVAEYSTFVYTLPANTFVDPEGDTLNYKSYSWMKPSWLTFTAATRTFTATPDQDAVGTWPITVIALDPAYAGASTTFNLTVTNVNSPPEITGTLTNQKVAQHQTWTYTIPAGTFEDPENNKITYYAEDAATQKLVPGMSFDAVTGKFTWTPDPNVTDEAAVTKSPYTINVYAYDEFGDGSKPTTFTLTVTPVNDAPYLNVAPADKTVVQGDTLTYTLDPATFVDPENSTISYKSYSWMKPSWISFNTTTKAFTISPPSGAADPDDTWLGTWPVTLIGLDPAYAGASTTFNVTVTNKPDSPPIINNLTGDTLAYMEGDGQKVLDHGLNASVTDSDSVNFNGGSLTVGITNGVTTEDRLTIQNQGVAAGQIGFYPGQFVTYGGQQIGTVTGDNSTALTVTLLEGANTESVAALLKAITYENTSSATPNTATRSVRFTLTDGPSGGSTAANMNITIGAVNSPPIITNLAGDAIIYNEGNSAMNLDVSLNAAVSDADSNTNFNSGYLEVRIASGFRLGDSLSCTAGTVGTVSYPEAGVMKITFADGNATPTTVATLLQSVKYSNTLANPPEGVRGVQFKLYDGDGGNGTAIVNTQVTVSGVNDEPVVSNLTGDSILFTEGDSAKVIDQYDLTHSQAMLADVDSVNLDAGSVTVQITGGFNAAQDKLSIRNQGNLSTDIGFDGYNLRYGGAAIGTVSYPTVDTMKIEFTSENATTTAVSALLQNITYNNTSAESPAAGIRTIRINVNDGDGGAAAPQTTTVTVKAVNDSPVIANLTGAAMNYVEGDPALGLDPDSNAVLTDVDGSLDLNGGKVMVQIVSGGDSSEDVLGIKVANGISSTTGPPTNLTYNGVAIGTASFTASSGYMEVTLNAAGATPEAVSALLQSITYSNTDTVNPTPGTRTIEFKVYDGDYTASPDLGTSAVQTVTVTVAQKNNAPVLSNIGNIGPDVTFTESTEPAKVADAVLLDSDSNAAVTDIDSTEDLNGGHLIVKIASGLVATEDKLTVRNEPGFGPDRIAFDGVNVTYGFKTIGTAAYAGGVLDITLNENANTTTVTRLLQNITYQNTNANNPSNANRGIQFTVSDGDGGSSLVHSMTVKVVSTNDPPVISNVQGDLATYNEDAAPVKIDQVGVAAAVGDVDNSNFSNGSLQVKVSSGYVTGEDVLGIQTSGSIAYTGSVVSYNSTMIGTAAYDAANGLFTVNLNKSATPDAVSALVQNITYSNANSKNPVQGNRTVQFQLLDGAGASSTAVFATVNVIAANDAPEIANLGGDSMNYYETDGKKVVDQVPTASLVMDSDDTSFNFNNGHLRIQVLGGDLTEDLINVSTGGNIAIYGTAVAYDGTQFGSVAFSNGLFDVTFNDKATTRSISQLIQGITYQNSDSYDPTAGIRTLRFNLTDGQASSPNYDVKVNVVATNNNPVISNLTDTLLYNEGDGKKLLDQGANADVADYDSTNFDTGKLTVQAFGTAAGSTLEDSLSIVAGNNIAITGNLATYGGTPIGTIAAIGTGGKLTVELNENATPASVSALLKQISFENVNTGNPVEGLRTVRFILNDGDGGSTPSLGANEVTVNVVRINDAPVLLNIAGDTATYSEDQSGVLLDFGSNALAKDADGTFGSNAHLTIAVVGGDLTEDRITISNSGLITYTSSSVKYNSVEIGTGTFNESTGMLDVTLNTTATESSVSALVQAVSYYNLDSNNPTEGIRTVRFNLTDSALASSGYSDMQLNVVGKNDAPVVTGLASDGLVYTEGAGAVVLDYQTAAAALVSDVDTTQFGDGVLRVSIDANYVAAEDKLSIRNSGTAPGAIGYSGGAVTYGGVQIGNATYASGALEVTFNENATTKAVSTLLQNITYENTNLTKPVESVRTIRFSITDGGVPAPLGMSGNISTVTVSVKGVNDAPVISSLHGDSVTFVEDGTSTTSVVLDQNPMAVVSDVDSLDFSSGELKVSFVGDASTGFTAGEDRLDVKRQTGMFGYDGAGTISYNGKFIGTVVPTVNATALTVTFNQNANADAVAAVIQNIVYYNTNTAGNVAAGTRTVRFYVTDGDGTEYGGLNSSAFNDVNVVVKGTNQPPAINNLRGDTVLYLEGATSVKLENAATVVNVTDVDSLNFANGYLQVDFSAGFVSGEDKLLLATAAGGIETFGNIITYQGSQIGAGTFDAATGKFNISLTEGANSNTVAELLKSFAYTNTDTLSPTTGERTLRYILADGDGADNNVQNVYSIVKVSDTNTAPTLNNISDSVLFTEKGPAVLIDMSTKATVTDIDSTSFSKLLVEITTGFNAADDELSISNAGFITYTGGNILYKGVSIGTGTYNVGASKGVLDMTLNKATANSEAVSALLQSVSYVNTNSQNPTTTNRIVQYSVWDAEGASSTYSSATVVVSGVNDAPVITQLHGDVVQYTEGAWTGTWVDKYSNAIVTDADGTSFGNAKLTVQVFGAYTNDDMLSTSAPGSTTLYTATSSAGYMTVSFGAAATDTTVSSVIQSLTFRSDSSGVVEGRRTLRFLLTDPAGASSAYNDVWVDVKAINNPPLVNNFTSAYLGSVTFTEDVSTAPVRLANNTTIAVADVDSKNFDTGYVLFERASTNNWLAADDKLGITQSSGIGYDGYNVSYNGTIIGQGGFDAAQGRLLINFNENATTQAVSTLLQVVNYQNTNTGNPIGGYRSLRFMLDDGDGVAFGGTASSGWFSMSVYVSNTNDTPDILNIANDLRSFSEVNNYSDPANTPILLDRWASATVFDADHLDFFSGKLTIDADGAPSGEDWLSLSSDGLITFATTQTGAYGPAELKFATTAIGGVTWDSSGAKLTIDFTGAGASNVTESVVSYLIQHVMYSNTNSYNPTEGRRTVRFTLYDGDGTAGTSLTREMFIDVTGANDAPQFNNINTAVAVGKADPLTGGTGGTRYYEASTVSGYQVALQTGAWISDADYNTTIGGPNFDTGWLKVSIDPTNWDQADDKLGISNGAEISVVNGNMVTYKGSVIGLFDYNHAGTMGLLTVNLNENASGSAGVSALLKSVTFSNVDTDKPTEGQRTIRFTFNDGDGGTATGFGVNGTELAFMTILVAGINDAPVLNNISSDVAAAAIYCGNSDDTTVSIILNPLASVTDVDSTNFQGATKMSVWLQSTSLSSDASNEDVLTISNNGNIAINGGLLTGTVSYTGLGEVGTYIYTQGLGAASGGLLTIDFGSASTPTAVSAMLQSIRYFNDDSVSMTGGNRTVRFLLSDNDGTNFGGVETSAIQSMLLTVNGGNSAPEFNNMSNVAAFNYSEGDVDGTAFGASGAQVLAGGTGLGTVWVYDADASDSSSGMTNFDGGKLTIQLYNSYVPGEDVLEFSTGGNITVASGVVNYSVGGGTKTAIGNYTWDDASGKLTIDFGTGANTSSVSSLLQNIAYKNLDSQDPTPGTRSIRFTMSDGDGKVGAACPAAGEGTVLWDNAATINVFADNDAPMLSWVDSDVVTFFEDGTANWVALDLGGNAVAKDVDSDFTKALLTVDNGGVAATAGEALSIRHQGIAAGQVGVSGLNISYGGVQVGTFTGAAGTGLGVTFNANANADAVSAIAQNIVFQNTAVTVDYSRSFRFMLEDGQAVTGTSGYKFVTVNVSGTNDAPTITALAGDAITFTEGDGTTKAAVLLDNPVGAVAGDQDNTDFIDGKLAVQLFGYDATEDWLGFSREGTVANMISVDTVGYTVKYGSSAFGTYNFNQAGGVLTVNFTSDGTTLGVNYMPAVSALIQNVAYNNLDSNNPTLGTRTARFTLWDGGTPSPNGLSSPNYDVKINVVADPDANDAPIIYNLNGESFTYIEEQGPALIDQVGISGSNTWFAATVFDGDSLNFDTGNLKVEFNGGFSNGDDFLSIKSASIGAGIYYDDYNVYYNGIVIGQGQYSAGVGSLNIELNENANSTSVAALIQNITYENRNTANPSAFGSGSRTVRMALWDGDNASSTWNAVTIVMSNVNDAPVLNNIAGDNVTYNEASSLATGANSTVFLDAGSNAFASDVDSTFSDGWLTVQLLGGDTAEDVLAVNTGAWFAGMTGTYSQLTQTLKVDFGAAGTTTTVQTLLRNVIYANLDTNAPTEGIRSVRWTLNDGDTPNGTGLPVTSQIEVKGENDAPVIKQLGDFAAQDSVMYYESQFHGNPMRIDQGSAAYIEDIDSLKFDAGSLKVQFNAGYVDAEDRLGFSNTAAISVNGNGVYYNGQQIGTFAFNNVTGVLTTELNENADSAGVSALLQNVTYYNVNSYNMTSGARTVRYTFNDGDGTYATADATVHVSAYNDAPTISNLGGDVVTFTEGDNTTVGVRLDKTPYASVSDPDNAAFSLSDGKLEVSITNSGATTSEDMLRILGGTAWNQFTVTGATAATSGALTYNLASTPAKGGWTYDQSAQKLVVDFNDGDANWTPDVVSALVQSIIYTNSDTVDPTAGNRNVQFALFDGGITGEKISRSSAAQNVTVTVNPVNSAPVISNVQGDTLIYSEGDPATLVDVGSNAKVSDLDNMDFENGHLLVKLLNPDVSEDKLGIKDEGAGDMIHVVGNQISFGATGVGTFVFDQNKGVLDVTLAKGANTATVSNLIQAITYENLDTDNPTTGNRTIKFTLSDGDGATSVGNYVTINVSGVNDAPMIHNLKGDSVTYYEGDGTAKTGVGVDFGSNAYVTDVDNTTFKGGELKIQSWLAAGATVQDMLSIQNQGSGAGQIGFDGGMVMYEGKQIGYVAPGATAGSMTVALNSDYANTTSVSALLKNVLYYNSNSQDPTTGTRTVRFTMSDGQSNAFVDASVGVVGVNDGPVIHDLAGDKVTFYEDSAPVALDQALGVGESPATVTDIDTTKFGDGRLQVQFVGTYDSTEDRLWGESNVGDIVFPLASGSDVTYGGVAIGQAYWVKDQGLLEIKLDDDATPAAVSALVQSITYQNIDTYSPAEGLRTVRFTMFDGDPAAPGASSLANDVQVTVVASNDPPTFFNLAGDSVAYSEGSAAVAIDKLGNGGVTDNDSMDFDTGKMEVQFTGGLKPAEDVLSIGNSGGIAFADGINVTYNGAVIGNASYDAANGLLKINLTENATTAATSALIQNITYFNRMSDAPTPGARTVRYKLWDGDGNSPKDSAESGNMTIFVSAVNDKPVISNLAGDTLAYYEGDGKQVLDKTPKAVVFDADNDTFGGGHLKVQIASGYNPNNATEDVLGIKQQYVGVSEIRADAGKVFYGGLQIGNVAYTPSDRLLDVTLNANANEENVSALVQSIYYENTMTDNPYTGNRSVQFTLSDGGGLGVNDATSDAYLVTVGVFAVNDAPVISNLNGDAAPDFTEGDGGTAHAKLLDVGGNALLRDVDNTNFNGGKVEVTMIGGDKAEDLLWIRNEGAGPGQIGVDQFGNITYGGTALGKAVFAQSSGILTVTINQNADTTAVSNLIQAVTYNNSDSDKPTEGIRTVRFTAFDPQGASSNVADTKITVVGINDAPIFYNLNGDTLMFVEGEAAKVLDVGTKASMKDVDTTEFGSGWVHVDITNPVAGQDELNINTTSTHLSLLYGSVLLYDGTQIATFNRVNNNATLEINLTEHATEARVSELLQNITYLNSNTVNPVEGARNIQFQMYDGDNNTLPHVGTSNISTVTVYVSGVNDAPELMNVEGDSITYYKNQGMKVLDGNSNAAVSDLDSLNFNDGELIVTIGAGNDPAEDKLGISTTAGFGISVVGNNVFYMNSQIGTYTVSPNEKLTVSFTENTADSNSVSALLKSVAYQNTNTLNPRAGDRVVSFVMDDGDGGVSKAYNTTVKVFGNQAPVLNKGFVDTLGTGLVWEVTPDGVTRLVIPDTAFTDPDDGTNLYYNRRYEFVDNNGDKLAVQPNWLYIGGKEMIAFPTSDVAGSTFKLNVYASDGLAESTSPATVTISVPTGVANHRPVIETPNDTFSVSEHAKVDSAVLYTVEATDADNDAMTYRLTTGGSNFAIDGSGNIRLTSADGLDFETGPKVFTLNIEVQDAKGAVAQGVATVNVQNMNDDPVVQNTIATQTVKAGAFFMYNLEDITTPGNDTFRDPDLDGMTYTAKLANGDPVSYTGWLQFSTNRFIGIPEAAHVGQSYSIELTAADGKGGTESLTFTINVVASLSLELRDAVDYLDTESEEYLLPVDGEDVEVHDVLMYAAETPAESVNADSDIADILALLDGDAATYYAPDVQDMAAEAPVKAAEKAGQGGHRADARA